MLRWLGLRPPHRQVAVDYLGADSLRDDDQLSLFVAAHFHQLDRDGETALLDQSASMGTAGFARNWHEPIQGRPRRFETIDGNTVDKFLTSSRREHGDQLASVTVREELAYDLAYKSGIDASGVAIDVSWHEDAIGPIAEFLNPHYRDFVGGAVVDCLIRFPLCKKFAFPDPRGGRDPYDGASKVVANLRKIAAFEVDWVEIGVRAKRFDSSIDWGEVALKHLLTDPTIVRLSV